jgi:integrase
MPNISTKKAQQRLKKRPEPYWQRLHKGCYLGFRRGPDTWIARYTIRDEEGRYRHQYRALDAHDYDKAKDAAEAWFDIMGSPAARVVKRGTVRAALETYLAYLCEQGREDTASNAENNHFKVTVWDDPIASRKLEDMTRTDFREWRERLREGRQNRSVNRQVRAVVAGLNRAVAEGHSGNPEAWNIDPLADDVEVEEPLFLNPKQRQSIINAASPACGDFLQSIEFTGGRPGELAATTIADLDKKGATLTLRHKKGRPPKVRARGVVLSDDALAFFKRQAKGKTPKAPLLVDPTGNPWGRHKWADEVQAAIAAVNAKARGESRIPKGASAYSFRHARISELLQDYGIDPLTVAHQTGTSLRMIEQHYHRFIAPALREKLAQIDSK